MSDIDNITINYSNSIDAIDVEYTNEIDTIVLSLGADAQSVFSVNGLTGNITLTASATLPSVSASLGIYSYTINHNLQYDTPIISLYNLNNSLVISDLEVLNANSVKIKSVIDLNGYKVVVQR
jgi:hypothetical protein